MTDDKHDCQHENRIINLEKAITKVKTDIDHYQTDLEKLEEALAKNTQAINMLTNQLSNGMGSKEAVKWIIGTFGMVILTIALTRIFN